MPIILAEQSASAPVLRSEGIEVFHEPPPHRPTLRVGLLNLMPDKLITEVQFARLLGASRHDVELVVAVPRSYRSRHDVPRSYQRWCDTSLPPRLDGLIVTGAPLEHLPFEDVAYWRDLAYIFEWATSNVGDTLHICWAAFAALYIFHGVRTRLRPYKIFGVFQQQVMDARNALTSGMGATFPCPVSRYASVESYDLPWRRGLICLAQSRETGLCLVADAACSAHYMFNHLEYDADTLKLEYFRDRARRAEAILPRNYLPNDDLSKARPLVWCRPAEKLFANWLSILAKHAHQTTDPGRDLFARHCAA
jgi:homoserine O-succinyltransferase